MSASELADRERLAKLFDENDEADLSKTGDADFYALTPREMRIVSAALRASPPSLDGGEPSYEQQYAENVAAAYLIDQLRMVNVQDYPGLKICFEAADQIERLMVLAARQPQVSVRPGAVHETEQDAVAAACDVEGLRYAKGRTPSPGEPGEADRRCNCCEPPPAEWQFCHCGEGPLVAASPPPSRADEAVAWQMRVARDNGAWFDWDTVDQSEYDLYAKHPQKGTEVRALFALSPQSAPPSGSNLQEKLTGCPAPSGEREARLEAALRSARRRLLMEGVADGSLIEIDAALSAPPSLQKPQGSEREALEKIVSMISPGRADDAGRARRIAVDALSAHPSLQKPQGSEWEAMARLSASEVACYHWPDDTVEHRALRKAFMDGAALAATGKVGDDPR